MTPILVADDSQAARQQLVEALQALDGIEVHQVSHGLEALQAMKQRGFAMLICDFEMPQMNGLQLLRTIRGRLSAYEFPVLMLTGRSSAKDKALLLRLGANDYITKPVEPEELSARVGVQLKLRQLQDEMLVQRELTSQSQKLEAIGQLAAGIAHEINTPIHYIGDNLSFLQEAFVELQQAVLTQSAALERAIQALPDDEVLRDALQQAEECDVEYLAEEVPRALSQSQEGVAHVAKIVSAMKDFSHPGQEEMSPHDINEVVQTTVTVACNEWKYVADVHFELADDLPKIPCLSGPIKQALVNLIVNAAHAIADKASSGEKGEIRIATALVDDAVEVRISDTGCGIPEEVQPKVFDPFFTTKDVGRGTGQGLAIARSVVVNNHNGSLTFKTQPGHGTTFVLRLPALENRVAQPGDAA